MSPTHSPWFVLVGGINGAGKSTFTQEPTTLRSMAGMSRAVAVDVINPDTETRRILAENPGMPESAANLQASKFCDDEVRRRIAERRGHFVIETVLSSDKYKRVVETALTGGWRFLFIYVALPSVEEAAQRVATRKARGGHDVPWEKIQKRWPISLRNLPWFWQRATAAYLFLNRPNFQTPAMLATKQRGWTRVAAQPLCPHAVEGVLEATASACGVGSGGSPAST